MVSIRDLDDEQFITKVQLRGKEIELWPLTFDDLLYIMRKFPVVGQALDAQVLTPEIIANLPEATAVIAEAIACASRDKDEKSLRGDETIIKRCMRFNALEQMSFSQTLLDISLPGGPRPFMAKLNALWSWLGDNSAANQQADTQSESSSQPSMSAELVGTPRPMRKRPPRAGSPSSTPSPQPSTTVVSQTSPVPPG